MKVLLALASLMATALGGVIDCGSSPLFSITKLSQSPDTYVKPGDNTTLTLLYKVPEGVTITGGKATTSLSLNGIPFTPSTDDLCTKVACPITSGEHDGSSWTTFPSGVTGKIVSKVTWTDSTGKELICIKSTFQASSSDSVTGPVNFLPSFNTLTPSQEEEETGKEMIPYFYEATSSAGSSTSSGSSSGSGNSTASGSSASGSGSSSTSGTASGTGSGSPSGSGSITINFTTKKLRGGK